MRYRPLDERPRTCGYFSEREAHFESLLADELSEEEAEQLTNWGFRCFGPYWFRPKCTACFDCVPIRLPVAQFKPTKSMRRLLKKNAHLRVTVGEPRYSDEKLAIFVDHSKRFSTQFDTITSEDFRLSFYHPTSYTLEYCYYEGKTLVAIGFVNLFPSSMSSVYFCYLNSASHLSLGTYSILQEIESSQKFNLNYYYLGYYIRDSHTMNYKASFYPNEVLTTGRQWVPFRDAKGKVLTQEDPRFTRNFEVGL